MNAGCDPDAEQSARGRDLANFRRELARDHLPALAWPRSSPSLRAVLGAVLAHAIFASAVRRTAPGASIIGLLIASEVLAAAGLIVGCGRARSAGSRRMAMPQPPIVSSDLDALERAAIPDCRCVPFNCGQALLQYSGLSQAENRALSTFH